MSAIMSECGKYRYVLKRNIPQCTRRIKKAVFIMFNPSTADAETDDPTVKKCIKFAEREGCTELSVINLYAFRATDPTIILKMGTTEAKGGDNFKHQQEQISSADLVIAAWGNFRAPTPEIESMLRGRVVYCLTSNKNGSPRHPLYIKDNKELEIFHLKE